MQELKELPEGAWHALAADAALADFRTPPAGLSETQATVRFDTFGPNRLPQTAGRSWALRVASQFHNLLIHVLPAAGVLAAFLGHAMDVAVIFAVVVSNAAIGFVQEGRAARVLEAIQGMIDPEAHVLRDGLRMTVAADRIAPGDIVWIEAGDRVPADLRLIHVRNLHIAEAVLTRESVAVGKTREPVAADAALGDRSSIAFSGTFVASGQGTRDVRDGTHTGRYATDRTRSMA